MTARGTLLLVLGFVAGTLVPHAQAAVDSELIRVLREAVGELRGIRSELQQMRRR